MVCFWAPPGPPGLQDGTLKEGTLQESILQEGTLQEDPLQEGTLQEGTLQGAELKFAEAEPPHSDTYIPRGALVALVGQQPRCRAAVPPASAPKDSQQREHDDRHPLSRLAWRVGVRASPRVREGEGLRHQEIQFLVRSARC